MLPRGNLSLSLPTLCGDASGHGAASPREQRHLFCPQTCPQSPSEELRFQSRFFPEGLNKRRAAQLGVINQESKGSTEGRQGLRTLSLQS